MEESRVKLQDLGMRNTLRNLKDKMPALYERGVALGIYTGTEDLDTEHPQSVFGSRLMGEEIAAKLPAGTTLLDCDGVEVMSAPFIDALLRAHPGLEFINLNEDNRESLDIVREHRRTS